MQIAQVTLWYGCKEYENAPDPIGYCSKIIELLRWTVLLNLTIDDDKWFRKIVSTYTLKYLYL